MNLFRSLLFWIVLALLGALVAQLMAQDPGLVMVSFGDWTYRKSLSYTLVLVLAVAALLWLAWRLLRAPFVMLRRRRRKAARARLIDGLQAVHLGHWSRAEKLLAEAADNRETGPIARIAAAHASTGRGDAEAARAHLVPLAESHPAAFAVATAELALADARPADALEALDAAAAQPLPPRGLALRAETLAALGRAGDAYGLLGALRQQQALPSSRLQVLEARWAEAGLREAADANVLADRWEALPKALRSDPAAVAAYAERAATLRWEDAAARSIEQALDTRWSDDLADLYGRLPIGRLDARLENAARWLQAHPASPGLLLTLARLHRTRGQWTQAEGFLHRALAQGGNAEAWEELGNGFAQAGDDARARQCYANALRVGRGEAPVEIPGRDLKQKIFDQAAIEERDEHGLPRLRG
ncbi:heme biosynthesis protein HemY [Marilutibacter alkalisoli]|uniref:Tetratricopeptide repeat protein n=1 Tax=Marilutibacter alkalisoli TaxID=2591633 RepID=A0A514BVJ8_9GAMM|nr:heme biosynthesis HemY N-terminal domain-containing protein [Lysobacter alkalisoli]QDH71406.1 tetratricopeptide repeat protein [Lysobacter alkalisoli]